MKKIAVIVPVYNMEKYLEECLDSIVNQSLKEIEIICINDGSTDNSLAILKSYAEHYSNIVVINQENKGVSSARNTGIKSATAEFVCFMDPDDYYLDDKVLEDLYTAALKNNVLVCGGSFSEDHGNWIRKEFIGIYTKYTFEKDGVIWYKDYQFDYGYHRFIYNREMLIYNNIYFPDYIRFQDPPFFVEAMVKAEKFYAMKRVTYCYRYGHQILKWDKRRSTDVLKGLIDNLRISNENKLDDLHRLTVDRLVREYLGPISSNLNNKDRELLDLLLYANSLIRKEAIEDKNQVTVSPVLLAAMDKTGKNLVSYDERLNEIYSSTTYRVGNLIMFIPKKIKIAIMDKKQKRG